VESPIIFQQGKVRDPLVNKPQKQRKRRRKTRRDQVQKKFQWHRKDRSHIKDDLGCNQVEGPPNEDSSCNVFRVERQKADGWYCMQQVRTSIFKMNETFW